MPEYLVVQVNVSMNDDDIRMLDQMMIEDAFDNRSAFVRRLIRQEWARRHNKLVVTKQMKKKGGNHE